MSERQTEVSASVEAEGSSLLGSPELVLQGLRSVGYLPNERIASVVYLGERLAKPVLVEGPAGTGKTELAKSVAAMSNMRLIRLQCYEGLDEAKALYEWNYKKQLLRIQSEQVSRSRPRRSCSRCSPTTRCRFPSSARSPARRSPWCS